MKQTVSLSRLGYLLLVSLFAFAVFLIFIQDSGMTQNPRASVSDMVQGRAHRPFVTRALVPALARALAASLPASLRQRLNNALPTAEETLPGVEIEPGWVPETLSVFALIYLSLLGFALAFQRFYQCFDPLEGVPSKLLPFVALLGLPPFFDMGYLYDLPMLFLCTLCFWALAKERWTAYLAAFTLATLNKETAVLFIPLFFLLQARRMPRRRLWRIGACQVLLFVLVRAPLLFLFRHNPGGFAEFHLWHFVTAFLYPYPLEKIMAWMTLLFLVVHRWEEKPVFLKKGLWMLAALFVLSVFFCAPNEIRDYLEAYPVLLALILLSVFKLLRR